MGINPVYFVLSICTFFTVTFAGNAYYVPKSFYVIDKNGHKSDIVHLVAKRSAGNGFSSSSSSSSLSSSSSGGGAPVYFGDGQGSDFGFPNPEHIAAFIQQQIDFQNEGVHNFNQDSGLPNGFFSRFGEDTDEPNSGVSISGTKDGAQNIHTSSSSNVQDGKAQFSVNAGGDGVNFESRSGFGDNSKGSYSSSSSSIDSNGKVSYSSKSGKF